MDKLKLSCDIKSDKLLLLSMKDSIYYKYASLIWAISRYHHGLKELIFDTYFECEDIDKAVFALECEGWLMDDTYSEGEVLGMYLWELSWELKDEEKK